MIGKKQAMAAHSVIGFDGVRVPFSQTFEAEALGCKVKPSRNLKGEEGIPGIQPDPPYKIDDAPVFPDDFLSRGKIPELIKAVQILKEGIAGSELVTVKGVGHSPQEEAPDVFNESLLRFLNRIKW